MHTRKKDLVQIKTLTDRRSFLDIQSNGKKWVSQSLVICIKPNNLDCKRVGFTVSKRIDKSAVGRNRIKRRLRAVAADVLSQYAKNGTDYVIMGRKETATRPYSVMVKDLKWCLKRTGYFHTNEN
ncbi:MAG: ribonuclease P protein component [Alphaproteobacteria bacterium]